ncbi:MAG: ABC transporter ATP-binding protein [Candidatus Bathyarchaeia archaeon]
MKRVMIKTVNLTKKYGDFTAVKDLNLEVYEGEFFCLLGPNGAGKTTTFLMLLGLTRPTYGSAWIEDCDIIRNPLEARKRVGFVPEVPGLYDDLTARENLTFTAELNGVPKSVREKKIKDLLDKVDLKGWADVKVGKFSRGMKQRLAIADALIKEPKVLMLDEPTAGIDPKGSEEILSLLENLSRKEGITILMSSHLLHHVEKYGDRIAIMKKGEIVATGSISSLVKEENIVEIDLEGVDEALISELNRLDGVKEVERRGNKLIIVAQRDIRREVFDVASKIGKKVISVKLTQSLERIYAKYFREEEIR